MISTAVFHTGVFINNELRKTPDAACRILCNRRIVRQSADRCLKQHPGDSRPYGRETTGRLQFRNSSNPKSTLSRLATRKQGKPKQYDRGENSSLEKSAKFYRSTSTYCLTSKDIQMFCVCIRPMKYDLQLVSYQVSRKEPAYCSYRCTEQDQEERSQCTCATLCLAWLQWQEARLEPNHKNNTHSKWDGGTQYASNHRATVLLRFQIRCIRR